MRLARLFFEITIVLYCPILLSGSHETMEKIMKDGKLDEWMQDNRKFLAAKFGEKNIISFALHADETTPHIHCSIVPIINDTNKKGKDVARLSANDMFNREALKQLQTHYAQAMRKWGLERGQDIEITQAKHQDVKQVYRDIPEKLALAEKAMNDFGVKNGTKSFLGGITGLNDLKAKNEALLGQNLSLTKEIEHVKTEMLKMTKHYEFVVSGYEKEDTKREKKLAQLEAQYPQMPEQIKQLTKELKEEKEKSAKIKIETYEKVVKFLNEEFKEIGLNKRLVIDYEKNILRLADFKPQQERNQGFSRGM